MGRYNIRVNAISPGLIETRMLGAHTKKSVINKIVENLPLKRIGNQIGCKTCSVSSKWWFFLYHRPNIRVNGGLLWKKIMKVFQKILEKIFYRLQCAGSSSAHIGGAHH